MTRKQIVLIVVANALISTLISLIVVALAALWLRDGAGASAAPTPQPVGTTATQQVAIALPSTTPIVHVVKAGDTLSGLALQYDVPAEDIIAANQIQNPNFLPLGAELIIPVGGVPQVTATLTPMPTATDTPIPFEPPSADMTATAAAEAGATATPVPTPLPSTGELQIEITTVIKSGQVDQEWVVLTNRGTGRAELQGWTLSDAERNTYTFPNSTVWPGGSVTVYTGAGQDGNPPSSLYWGKLQPIWSPGEIVTLRNVTGKVIAIYKVGP